MFENSTIVQRAKILSANKKIEIGDLILDTDNISDKPNTAEILAAKFKASEHMRYFNENNFINTQQIASNIPKNRDISCLKI